MSTAGLTTLLAFAPSTAPGTQPDPKAQMLQMVGTFVFMGLVMYFLIFRPQQKKSKQQALLMKNLKAGDRVVTSSGIIGTVLTVKEKSISLRSLETKLEVLKSAIVEVTQDSSPSVES
ncbi:MAG: preprotein translocase subunit YajC [Verrucomicrobia bacterium]|nr:preprotein translocase subunit YajC [Verrucomicrobiota bacterium]